MSEWVNRRFEVYQGRVNEENRRARLEGEAAQAARSLYSQLRDQIRGDVIFYGQRFKWDACLAVMEEHTDGIAVTCRGNRVTVAPPVEGMTIVKVTYIENNKTREDHLQIVHDGAAQLRFKHKDRVLDSMAATSEAILDPVLCK